VAGPGVEVRAERADVERHVRRRPARRRPTTIAPAACARRAISAIGLIVPSTLETCATATAFGERASRPSSASRFEHALVVDRT
jgi:hypothetical protein